MLKQVARTPHVPHSLYTYLHFNKLIKLTFARCEHNQRSVVEVVIVEVSFSLIKKMNKKKKKKTKT